MSLLGEIYIAIQFRMILSAGSVGHEVGIPVSSNLIVFHGAEFVEGHVTVSASIRPARMALREPEDMPLLFGIVVFGQHYLFSYSADVTFLGSGHRRSILL